MRKTTFLHWNGVLHDTPMTLEGERSRGNKQDGDATLAGADQQH